MNGMYDHDDDDKIYQDMIDDVMKVPLGEKPKPSVPGHGGVHITIATGKAPMGHDGAPSLESPDEKHKHQMAKLHAMGKGM